MTVILYTRPKCAYCTIAKSYLDSVFVDYEERDGMDVEEVPLLVVGRQRVVGWKPREIDAVLRRAGLR